MTLETETKTSNGKVADGDKTPKLPVMPEILSLEEDYAISIIGRFLPSWRSLKPSDVTMSRVTGGYLNTVYSVIRKDVEDEGHSHRDCPVSKEPSKVLLRRYGGTWIPRSVTNDQLPEPIRWLNTEAEEVMIFQEQSRLGYGPKLLGVFDGGRVEELLEGRTLKTEDLDNIDIERDLAVSYARINSLKLPLADKTERTYNQILPWPQVSEQFKQKFRDLKLDTTFLDIDMNAEKNWLKEQMENVLKARIVLCQFDTNFLNVFIRDNPKSGQSKTVLLDYEMSKYTYRGCDVGGHFVNRTIKWDGQPDKLSGHPYPTLEVRKRFLMSYIEESKRLGYLEDFDPSGRDSLDNLVKESLLGSALNCLYFGSRVGQKIEEIYERERGFATLAPHLMAIYRQVKKEYLDMQ